MSDGGMLYRGRCGKEGLHQHHIGQLCSDWRQACTLADYLGVGTGVLEAYCNMHGGYCDEKVLRWRETPPEPNADDVRTCADAMASRVAAHRATFPSFRGVDNVPIEDLGKLIVAARAWLKSHP